ncbi:MAG: hypothetical protein GY774_31330 [Planctomycetes bacterium]|nr:hypothetical protein [Planctomycetota bacterium]
MKSYFGLTCTAVILILFSASNLYSNSGPFDGKNFKGRIAFSSDGNYNDEDDWGAFPVAIAMLDSFKVKNKLVHVDYNNILAGNDPRFYKEMSESVLGSVKRYNISHSILFDCQKDLNGAIENIKNAINASSADNPLYYVLAGPMEVPYRGIEKSDPDKRKYVYCISHSNWNDGYTRGDQNLHNHNKRDVIPSGINWIQVKDGNRNLAHPGGVGKKSTPEQWSQYHWFRDSSDSRLKWIFTRLEAELRADISDSTMTYFLLTGDEDANLTKMKRLLDDKKIPAPMDPRKYVRIEAENFRTLDNYSVEHRNDRRASHRLSVRLAQVTDGYIRTPFDQPYTVGSSRYDVDIRYFDEKDGRCRFALYVNDVQKGNSWRASQDGEEWTTHTIENIPVNSGDEIMVKVLGDSGEYGKLDYVQFSYRSPGSNVSSSAFSASGPLDDPDALPGQVIVAGSNPGYLKYNGGGPVFLCGPDNPEDFLFRGTLNPDGTRSGGGQMEAINRMAKAGVNAFHCQMTRMRRCNYKDEGDDTHSPFVDHDPSKGLDEDILNQWDGWLDKLEENGIIVHLEFYNDATDVEMMDWKLDSMGNLPPDEKRWIQGIVKRFKHHKNIMWGIEESCNKLPASRTPHFKKIGELIARTDNHNHPIVQSFVVPNDPEGDFPADGITSDEYIGDPYIRVVTWLHVVPHGDDFEKQHQEYLRFFKRDAAKFVVMKNETYHHPRRGHKSRKYMWSCATTGMHCLEAYHHAGDASHEDTLRDDGLINTFMEQTDFHKMKPRDDLAAGSTKWVLANPGNSYIAYTYDYSGPMGVKGMTSGNYDLMWFDTVDGDTVHQTSVSVYSSRLILSKPDSIGKEIALYIKRLGN